jgi:hypothetical protein
LIWPKRSGKTGSASRSGRYDMGQLKEAMPLLIANDAPLPPDGAITR